MLTVSEAEKLIIAEWRVWSTARASYGVNDPYILVIYGS